MMRSVPAPMKRIERSVISELFPTSYCRRAGGIAAGARKPSLKIRNSSSKSNAEFKAKTLPDGGREDKTSVVHTGIPTVETRLAGPKTEPRD
jgi:hypothetical protein